jgi:hypothetical protein
MAGLPSSFCNVLPVATPNMSDAYEFPPEPELTTGLVVVGVAGDVVVVVVGAAVVGVLEAVGVPLADVVGAGADPPAETVQTVPLASEE